MKRKRYSDEQIAFALRQAENGPLIDEIWRLKRLEEENRAEASRRRSVSG